MYIKSFKYYFSLYGSLPSFDKGLGLFFFPMSFIFLITGILVSPLLLVQFFLLKKRKSKYKIVEFVFSKNQLKVSKQFNIKNSLFINCITKDKIRTNNLIVSNKKLLFISVLNGVEVFFTLFKALNNRKLRSNSIRLIKIIALSKIAKYHLSGSKLLLQYNDHSPYNVLLYRIAKNNTLNTMYVQHAPVSFKFPPLYHDLNILFSEDSFIKYKQTTGNEILKKNILKLFDFRLPDKKTLPKRQSEYILLCINKLDNLKEVNYSLEKLVEDGFSVKLRPHPADKRNFKFNDKVIITKKGDSIWKDLSLAKAVIVNESAVPLESLFYDIPTYKLSKLSEDIIDNYGFVERELLLKDYKSIEEIIKDIKAEKIVWDRSQITHFIGNIDDKENCLKKMKEEINKLIL